MAKIVYRQMPATRELSQEIPAPWAKARMQKPQGGTNFWCKSPGVRGGMVMDETDTCIRSSSIWKKFDITFFSFKLKYHV